MQRRLPTVSPSAARQHLKCPRARAFIDLDKYRPPQMPWNASGTRMHDHLEVARKTGELPDQTNPEARVASAAIQYWPDRPWDPEQGTYLEREGFAWKGKSDQFGPAFVGDYKFTGNKKNIPGYYPRIKNWALANAAGDELINDVQWLTYGLSTPDDGTGYVDGQWTYVVKPPKMEGEPTVIPVRLKQSRDAMDASLEYWDAIARHLVEVRESYERANDVPHQADTACMGVTVGCDFAHLCEITNNGKQEIMATLAEIMAQNNIPTGQNEAEPEKPPEKPKKETKPKRERKPRPKKGEAAKAEPTVNPPEGEDRDEQATVEEVAKPTTAKERKARNKPATTSKGKAAVTGDAFEATITGGNMMADGLSQLTATTAAVIPVGATVRIEVIG